MKPKIIILSIFVFFFAFYDVLAYNDGNTKGWSWAEQFGWINFSGGGGGTLYGVQTSSDQITGYAWSEKTGWISFNCLNKLSCGTLPYGVVSDGTGNLTGYAWSEKGGWINFAGAGAVNYQVKVDSNKNFSGYAWSEELGWINTSNITDSYGVTGAKKADIQTPHVVNTNATAGLDYGLVGYWPFNGGDIVAGTAFDRSGQNNNGILSGTVPVPVEGLRGQGLSFGGSNGYLEANDSSTLDIGGNLTLSAWVKNPQSSGVNSLLDKGDQLGGTINYGLSIESNQVWFYTQGTTNANWNSGFDFASYCGSQCQITATYDGQNKKVYINGVERGSVGATGTPTVNNYTLRVGADGSSANNRYAGILDEVRVYNRALSATEVGDLYRLGGQTINTSLAGTNKSGLVGHWTFDGANMKGVGVGGTAYDSSGQNNNGILSNPAPTQTEGKLGQALNFDGTGGTRWVSVLNNASLNVSSVATISAWFKLNSIPAGGLYQRIVDRGEGSEGYYIAVDGNKPRYRFFIGSNTYGGDGNATLVANQWYHAVITFDGTNCKYYLNGASDLTSDGQTGSLSGATWKLGIGRTSDGTGNGFPGSIDDVRVYSRALSAGEVGDLYRGGHAVVSK